MRKLGAAAPHFTDRVTEAQKLVASHSRSPALAEADRQLLSGTLRNLSQTIADHGVVEQLLHGEPHPGNVLSTKNGPLFIDFETCCRGPIEFDLAHVPDEVSADYPNVDRELLGDCRGLVLAIAAAWRWDVRDEFPNGAQVGQELVRTMRKGPPWPALDVVMRGLAKSGS